MTNHAAIGAKILEHVPDSWGLAKMVRHHHEKYDGSGYPDNLKGKEIPLGARVISVAVVYDALICHRCYRPGWTHREAVECIESLSSTHFDPDVVDAFMAAEPEIAAINGANPFAVAVGGVEPGECLSAATVIAQANNETIGLFELAQDLSSTLEIDEVLSILAHRTRSLSQADSCVVFIVDKSDPRQDDRQEGCRRGGRGAQRRYPR